MAENLKEQRKDFRSLSLVEKTGEYLSEIKLTTSQLTAICNSCVKKCQSEGGGIALSSVLRSIIDDIKLILEKEQIAFIASHGIKMNLKGVDIIIRPVAPRDRPRFLEGINKLSSDTLFLRFLSPIRELSASQVDYLLNVDFEDHFAVAAVVDESSYPGMAITRYIRSYENPAEAEWAVTVVDKYQGLGLGRIMLYLINLIAFEHGIKVFAATIHPTNRRILAWMEELGATMHSSEDGRVWKFPLPIPESFMAKEEIREKLVRSACGKGDIPLFVAADMSYESYEKMMSVL